MKPGDYYINKKNEKMYRIIFEAVDTTNNRDGLEVVVYCDSSKIFVRERLEFLEKFEKFVHPKTFSEERRNF
jgi:hypothetical protein